MPRAGAVSRSGPGTSLEDAEDNKLTYGRYCSRKKPRSLVMKINYEFV
jgi:hypothetical protein